MQGNSHVRFGERREETGHREVARRFAPTLPWLSARTLSGRRGRQGTALGAPANPQGRSISEGPERRADLERSGARSRAQPGGEIGSSVMVLRARLPSQADPPRA